MKLYHFPLSGHSHRAQLFLSLLDIDHEVIGVEVDKGAHKQPDYLQLNPFGQVPVLVDGDTVVPDSNAILVYLAKKSGKTEWLPESPDQAAAVQRWLSVAAGEIAYGPAAARLITVFGMPFHADEVIQRAHVILARIEAHLEGREWIATRAHPSVADIALYSYIARAPEGNVDLGAYPRIGAWLKRIEALPRFVPFTKTPVGLEARS